MKKDRNYLIEMYYATSTDDGKGELETYEAWLERQLLSRILLIERIKSEEINKKLNKEFSGILTNIISFTHSNRNILEIEVCGIENYIGNMLKIDDELIIQHFMNE